jgi:hypothetical protein
MSCSNLTQRSPVPDGRLESRHDAQASAMSIPRLWPRPRPGSTRGRVDRFMLVEWLIGGMSGRTRSYERFAGRPWQRRRADRLIAKGRVRSILFDADDGVLPFPCLDGVAEVSDRRIRLGNTEVWVRDIEGDPAEGPIHPFAEGTHRPSYGNMAFRPRTAIFTLRLDNGSRVRWTVLQHRPLMQPR